MIEMEENKIPEGLLKGLFSQMGLSGLMTPPMFKENELEIAITEEEMDQVLKRNLDERAKNAIRLKLENGKLVIKVKLW
jgi:hypothetical protein